MRKILNTQSIIKWNNNYAEDNAGYIGYHPLYSIFGVDANEVHSLFLFFVSQTMLNDCLAQSLSSNESLVVSN
jgi:hypothetical protein